MDASVALGGTSLSAGLADSQTQLAAALGETAGFGTDSVAQFAAAYRTSGGGPTLRLLGFNPFSIVANGAFHTMYWAAIVAFLGIMSALALHHVLNGRYAVRGRHPLHGLLQVYFRLAVGSLLIANLPLLYGMLMTLNHVATDAVRTMAGSNFSQMIQQGGMGALTMARARADAIRDAALRRTMALYPTAGSRAEMQEIGNWYNAVAAAINARASSASGYGSLPLLEAAAWEDASVPDDRVIAAIGRGVVRYFPSLVASLGALPADSGPLSIAFPGGAQTSLPLLSTALGGTDAAASKAFQLAAVPSTAAGFNQARNTYSEATLAATLHYLDTSMLPLISASPTLATRAKAWFSHLVEEAAVAGTGFLDHLRKAIDWIGRSVGIVFTRIVAFVFTIGTEVLLEIELFMLVLTVPLWLLPATEDAFHGVLRSLVALTLAAPAYQFLMLFVDALMSLILRYLMLGPLAAGNPPSAGGLASGVVYGASALLAVAGTGGEFLVMVMACYLCAYAFLAVYLAFKTPKLVAAALKGAGAATQFLGAFATGLVAGAATAATTAAVAGIGPAIGGPARPAAGVQTRAMAVRPIRLAQRPRPVGSPPPAAPVKSSDSPPDAAPCRPSAPAWETLRFGAHTFVECLDASSPADAYATAFRALDAHRRRKEKETEARYKSEKAAAKAAAPRPTRARK